MCRILTSPTSKSTRELPLYGAILLPPLAIAITDPDIFFAALDTAGTFGTSFLCGVLPAAMAWSQRYSDANRIEKRSGEQEEGEDENGESILATLPLVPGGKATLAGACVSCVCVFVRSEYATQQEEKFTETKSTAPNLVQD